MKAIRRLRNAYALLFAVSVCLAGWYGVQLMMMVSLTIGALSSLLLVLLAKQSHLLRDAGLIWDNRILTMESAAAGGKEKKGEETVVSTFGILIGSKIYKWGSGGVHGVRLKTVEFDHTHILFVFGDAAKTTRVEILHDLESEKAVLQVREKLWRDTGIRARISGW